jgi:PAS domain S-box-containing protein
MCLAPGVDVGQAGRSRAGPALQWLRRLGVGIALAVLYVLAAKLGLAFAFLHPSASPVWPPTGLALAALLILGAGAWPAIFAGAFVANLLTAGSLATSLGIALGNTLEAVIGAWLVTRFAGGAAAFDRAPDIFKFFCLGGVLSPVVSATLGVMSLGLGGFVPWMDFGAVWATWWLGDAAGALVVAPLLLLWSRAPVPAALGRRPLEALGLLGTTVAVGLAVFGEILPVGMQDLPVGFLCIPPLLWAAFRFGVREAATLVAALTAVAVAGTLRGTGAFALATPNGSLLLLQVFMATLAFTVLPLAALAGQLRGALAEKDRLLGECEQAEAAVRDSEAQLHGMVQAAMDAIIALDERQRIVVFNQAAEQMFRCQAAEVVGQPLDRFIPPRVRDAHRRHVEEFGRRGVTARAMGALGELTGVRADGEEFPIEASISQAAVGGQKRLTVILRDISERKRDAHALGAQTALLQAILDQAADGILARDAGGRVLFANAALRRLAWEAPEGKTLAAGLDVWGKTTDVDGKALPVDQWPMSRALRGETVRAVELHRTAPDGTPYVFLNSCAPIRNTRGEIIGAVAINTDITERKRAEDQLRQALADREALLREVHHRTKNSLQMLADLLYLKAEGVESPDGKVAFGEASARIFALARLHEELYISMDRGRVQLGSYVRGIVQGLRALGRNATIGVEVPDQSVHLDLDRTVHVGLIVTELVTNAQTHAFPDGRSGQICVRLRTVGNAVELEVRDNGRGLPPDFNPEQTKTLGLRIVHVLAQRLHATVSVDSRDGAAFTLAFPLDGDAPVEP